MSADAYRLWQACRQMHYPDLPPAAEANGVDLVALDGRAGACLEQYFMRRGHGAQLNGELRKALEQCAAELNRVEAKLSGDAAHYFDRLHQLLSLVLAEPIASGRLITVLLWRATSSSMNHASEEPLDLRRLHQRRHGSSFEAFLCPPCTFWG